MIYILETQRLRLRKFNLHDAAFIIELFNSPAWLLFIGDRNVRTEEQAIAYLRNGPIKSYLENGFGLYMVEIKDTGLAIGMCGILKRDTLENPDIGFALLPEHTGKGYARECSEATIKYAFETLQIPKIYAIVKPDNQRSIRLLEALGLKFEKRLPASNDKEEMLVYSLDKSD